MLTLNPKLSPTLLATRFQRQGWLQIPDFIASEQADALHRCLAEDVPWGLAWFEDGARYLRAGELAELSEDERANLEARIQRAASHNYQYRYGTYPILDAYLGKWHEVPLLDSFLEALNTPAVLDLMRAISGHADIIKADAQATRYGPGDFLRLHSDASPPGQVWRVAYVLNLTPRWQPDWGGYLQFFDKSGDVTRALKPRYNVLNLLAVPQDHNVAMVSPFADGCRYAITGWFRAR